MRMSIFEAAMDGGCPWKIRPAMKQDVPSIVWLTQSHEPELWGEYNIPSRGWLLMWVCSSEGQLRMLPYPSSADTLPPEQLNKKKLPPATEMTRTTFEGVWLVRLETTKLRLPKALYSLNQLLAEFENEPKSMKIGEKEFLRDGFGDRPYFHVLLAELTNNNTSAVSAAIDPDRPSTSMPHNDRIVGHALYFYTYSTWEGKCLYLEDLFVHEEYRNRGIGSDLMQGCAKVACEEECARMQWQVLDWNTRATDLYERIGGKIQREWLTIRMASPELGKFASGEVSISNYTSNKL